MSDTLRTIVSQLRSTLGRLELALSLAHDGLVWIDDGGRIIWCNAAFDALSGKSHVAVLGDDLVDLLPLEQGGRIVPPEDHPARRVFREDVQELTQIYQMAREGQTRVLEVSARRRPVQVREEAVIAVHDVTARALAEAQMRALNVQLEATNQELEAFSYSVSHDLRAPLRAIDGFSQALLEDYGDRLEGEGEDYLRRIRRAAQNMGQLIDDMLTLSRVTRTELSRETVDISELARSIAADLRERDPAREVEIVVQDGLAVEGDGRLLRQAFENLLENAWKFTGKVPRARIEVGRSGTDGEEVFFVADNGAGFDMAFADRLFGAFQRLHTSEDFPGSGIGLATVRRIVHRHGGRVWAEGAIGGGARFYLALPHGGPPVLGERQ